ncbi:hypothetical protein DN402_06045 [Streptomyces sp. SW4]|nr:hypothetical protein DN402_06045 [Streptomyces sp. SW4]
MPTNNELTMLFFLQLAAVLAVCRIAGLLLRRLGQPQVVADMVAGFLLGPTLLGHVFPALFDDLFPQVLTVPGTGTDIQHPALATLFVAGQLGLVLYMFVVGLKFDHSILAGHVRQSAVASAAGVLAPIVAGGVLGWYLAGGELWFADGVAAWQAALFVGAACGITAFPMLARIVHERGMTRTTVGTVALACAAVDDAAAWILLAVVVAAAQGDPVVALLALGGSAAYVVVLLAVKRFAGTVWPAGARAREARDPRRSARWSWCCWCARPSPNGSASTRCSARSCSVQPCRAARSPTRSPAVWNPSRPVCCCRCSSCTPASTPGWTSSSTRRSSPPCCSCSWWPSRSRAARAPSPGGPPAAAGATPPRWAR